MERFIVALSLLVMFWSYVNCDKACSHPLGMENGDIKDSQITVSSTFRSSNSGKTARLHRNITNWGAWCPNVTANSEKSNMKYDEYIQIDLLNCAKVTMVATQGREYRSGIEHVKRYQISYSNYNSRNWIHYKGNESSETKIFLGNTDVRTVVESKIDPPIIARYIRIHPGYTKGYHACLRLELYGCSLSGKGCIVLVIIGPPPWTGPELPYPTYIPTVTGENNVLSSMSSWQLVVVSCAAAILFVAVILLGTLLKLKRRNTSKPDDVPTRSDVSPDVSPYCISGHIENTPMGYGSDINIRRNLSNEASGYTQLDESTRSKNDDNQLGYQKLLRNSRCVKGDEVKVLVHDVTSDARKSKECRESEEMEYVVPL